MNYVYCLTSSIQALEMGSVETLIVWEGLETTRIVLKNHQTDEEKVMYLDPEQEKDKSLFVDKETGVEMELVDKMAVLEWFANNYKKFGMGVVL
jgi:peptide chain release factor subunit 1